MINFLKNLGIVALVIGGLTLLGSAINHFLPWFVLTNIFSLIRLIIKPLAFTWDIVETYKAIGYGLQVISAFYVFKGTLIVVRLFQK